jgi:DNA-binding winged helix-turn-helix (wHTH) protein/DNA-binding CsgD family transcriptional regulator
MVMRFGDVELDMDLFEVRREGEPVPVEPQVFDVLSYLVRHRDRVVTKHELLDEVWKNFVTESALTTRIKAARRAVGDDGRTQRVIRTIHGRGYRFVAPVTTDDIATTDAVPPETGATTTTTDASSWPLVGRGEELDRLAIGFRDDDCGGVALVGPAGMGKTRLAEESLRLAGDVDIPVARAAGHPQSRSIPLAGLAHLLDPSITGATTGETTLDRSALFHRSRAALVERAGDQRLLMVVDDADQLDDLSRALLTSLIDDRTVFAVMTIRHSGGALPAFDDLVGQGRLVRVDLGPLDNHVIADLLAQVLGGQVEPGTLERLTTSSAGNPGVLQQLVETALDQRSLRRTPAGFELLGRMAAAPTLERLVQHRLASVEGEDRAALDALAIAGEIGLEVLGDMVGDEVLDDLDRRGLITLRTDRRRLEVGLAHPLYGELLRAELSPLRGRRIRQRLATAVESRGARRRDDGIRLVAWRSDEDDADPALLLEAARLALLGDDDATAQKLLDRLPENDRSPGARRLEAELLFRRGDTSVAMAMLEELPGEIAAALDDDSTSDTAPAGDTTPPDSTSGGPPDHGPVAAGGEDEAALSPREQEVADLARLGLSSREIAERLYVSTRTVDNHLRKVYATLGLTGRHEL